MSKKLMLLLTLLSGHILHAQKDSAGTRVLDEVVVTANKLEQKQSSTGKVITVIAKDQINKSMGRTVAQVLNETVGITINGTYNNAGTNQSVFMRGAATGRTLILLDGIPVSDPSQINNEFDLNLFSINDVERIEICKGAQSTVYGSDAIAGVINIITIKPNASKEMNVNATLSAGNLGTFRNSVQLYGKINKLAYSVRTAQINTNGFSAATDTTGIKNYDKDAYHGNASSASAQYQVNNQLSIKAFGMYSAYKTGIDAGVFNDDKYYNLHNNVLNTGTGFQYKLPKITLTGNYQFSQTNRNYERDSLDKSAFSFFVRNTYFSKTQFAELYATLPINNYIHLLQGFEYRYGSMNNNYNSVSVYGPYAFGFNDTSISQSSAYTSLQINNKKGFFTDLGIRFNKHAKYGNNTTFTINPSYSVSETVRIFGSIASGFKAPSLYQLFDKFSGNPNLQPEKSVTYEAGIATMHSGFNSRLVVFYRDINSGIDYDYVRSNYFNFVKQSAIGVEYETSTKLSKQLEFKANFSFLSINDSTQSRQSFKDTGYVYGLRRPGININASFNYQQDQFFASISTKYVSSRYDIGGYKKADIAMAGYMIVNAYAEYRIHQKIKIFADAQNIGNKTFVDVRGFNSIPMMINTGITINL